MTCKHNWKMYVGFTDEYEYCEKCGVQKKDTFKGMIEEVVEKGGIDRINSSFTAMFAGKIQELVPTFAGPASGYDTTALKYPISKYLNCSKQYSISDFPDGFEWHYGDSFFNKFGGPKKGDIYIDKDDPRPRCWTGEEWVWTENIFGMEEDND